MSSTIPAVSALRCAPVHRLDRSVDRRDGNRLRDRLNDDGGGLHCWMWAAVRGLVQELDSGVSVGGGGIYAVCFQLRALIMAAGHGCSFVQHARVA